MKSLYHLRDADFFRFELTLLLSEKNRAVVVTETYGRCDPIVLLDTAATTIHFFRSEQEPYLRPAIDPFFFKSKTCFNRTFPSSFFTVNVIFSPFSARCHRLLHPGYILPRHTQGKDYRSSLGDNMQNHVYELKDSDQSVHAAE